MRRKNRSKYREIVLSILIVGALLAVSVSLFKPSITGFIVLQESNSIEMEFTSDESIALPIKDITALYINSYISNNFSGEVFLNDENRRYKILDYSIPELNEEVENSSIEFELNYNKISSEVAELSVAAEQYSCVEWKINDESLCYGENSCCSLLNLESSGEKNESLYLNKGKYNAQDRNIVKAQVIYANYSLDIDNAYSEISYSDIKGIVVDIFDKLSLSNICGEACNLNQNANAYTLEIKVYSGSLFLENYTYQLSPNNAPEFKEVPNITFSGSYTLDLSKYITDKDNNELNIDYLHVNGISIEFDGLTAVIKADSNFTGKAYTFFTVNDSLLSATSNIIELDVVEFKPKVVVGEAVRWVKKASVIDNKVLLEHEPINVTVKVDDEEILDRNVGIIVQGERKDLDEYEYDKKIEEMNKEIGKEIKAGRSAASLEEKKKDFVKSKRLENTGMALRKLISITGNVVLNEEEEGNTVLVINEDVPEVEIEYFTEAPIAIEEEMDNGKRVTISSDIHYEDVLAFAEIQDTDANSIKLYHLVNGSRIPSNFDGYDSNENGLVDYIEWTVPHLSNQTYEIILITEAEHLDENRTFVEDVYDYVKTRDSNFTLVPANHYLRVKFETNLTSSKDITIYAKSNYSNASVLIYEKDKNDSIAQFDNVSEDKMYKVYLTSLQGSQDIFDLRTTNDVEFDYVVDPIGVSACGALNTPNTQYDLIADLSAITGCIQINASNIIFDGHGHTITYGIGGKGNGINATGKVNITIKSTIIAKGSNSGTNNFGILLTEVENGTIINNTIRTNGTGDNYGVYLQSLGGAQVSGNNVTLNTISTDGTSGANYGIYCEGAGDKACGNNTFSSNNISTTGAGNNDGIRLNSGTSDNIIISNMFDINGTNSNYAISLNGAENNIIRSNIVSSLNCSGSDGTGIRVPGGSHNNLITGNSITTRCSNGIGIYLENSVSNNNVTLNTISTNLPGSDNYGIRINGVNNTIASNNIATSGTGSDFGIRLEGGYNNIIKHNTINNTNGAAIRLEGSNTFNNTFINNTINSNDSVEFDLSIGTAGLNETYFIDSYIRNYTFTGTGSIVYFKESAFGEVRFLQEINGSGGNLSHALKIGDNSALVNVSIAPGLNRSANITIYNLPTNSNNASIFREGSVCDGTTTPSCYNLTSFNAGTVIFNVSAWSEYSIVNTPIHVSSCGVLNTPNAQYSLTADVSSSNHTCIMINASNVTFDGHGHKISFGSKGRGVGMNASTLTGITIKGVIINKSKDNLSEPNNYGIYFFLVGNSTIFNTTIITNGTSSNYGIYLNFGRAGNNISSNTIITGGSSSGNHGIFFSSPEKSDVIMSNTITTGGSSSSDGIIIAGENQTLTSNNITVISSGSRFGINFAASNSTLISNTITTGGGGSDDAIYISGSSNNITSNTIIPGGTGNNRGIYVAGFYNTVTSNNITIDNSNAQYGIQLGLGYGKNTLTSNNIVVYGGINSGYGIYAFQSSNNTLISNNITTNGTSDVYGIIIWQSSNLTLPHKE